MPQQPPVNNFISTNQPQTPSNTLVEWRVLNETEEVDNLYVANKTLFINDSMMILKGIDGSLEKWEVKKIYPEYISSSETNCFKQVGHIYNPKSIVDAVIDNLNTCKYFVVITEKRQEISDFIIKELHHGATISTVVGEYTKNEKCMIHTVCKRIEAIQLRRKIKEIDPHAFIIITTSSEIIGRGFRSI